MADSTVAAKLFEQSKYGSILNIFRELNKHTKDIKDPAALQSEISNSKATVFLPI